MILLKALWGRIWPYIAAVGVVLAGLLAVRQSGKSAARTEAAAKINEQAAQARKEQRDVENEIASLDDDAVDRRLDEWVRRK
ncbi:hypothetical protein V0R37_18620 [Pollutimonas sp. H1-120]|uniref:hypothetical protein n=1 Tax=Pollutimonas sp. H1-120 TaxID=3148824 RepID=UPI003B52A901